MNLTKKQREIKERVVNVMLIQEHNYLKKFTCVKFKNYVRILVTYDRKVEGYTARTVYHIFENGELEHDFYYLENCKKEGDQETWPQ